MDLKLLDRIDFGATDYVELQQGGESMMHPQLDKIIEYIKGKGIMVGVSTNGTIDYDWNKFDVVTTTVDPVRRRLRIDTEKYPNVFVQRLAKEDIKDHSHKVPYSGAAPKACVTPFNYVSIHWDGDVVPCCQCAGKQHVFGNLYDMTMEQIWNSTKRADFLSKMKTAENYICKFCDWANPHEIHEGLVKWKKEGGGCSKPGGGCGFEKQHNSIPAS